MEFAESSAAETGGGNSPSSKTMLLYVMAHENWAALQAVLDTKDYEVAQAADLEPALNIGWAKPDTHTGVWLNWDPNLTSSSAKVLGNPENRGPYYKLWNTGLSKAA